MMRNEAVHIRYPNQDQHRKIEVELSLSGAKKGCAIGAIVASRIPHPASIPIGVLVGGILGGVLGKAD